MQARAAPGSLRLIPLREKLPPFRKRPAARHSDTAGTTATVRMSGPGTTDDLSGGAPPGIRCISPQRAGPSLIVCSYPPAGWGITTHDDHLACLKRALAGFLRLDSDLLDVAAEASPPRPSSQDDPGALAACIAGLPDEEKARLLLLVAQDQRSTGQDGAAAQVPRRYRQRRFPA
jgi:hypothetical protein